MSLSNFLPAEIGLLGHSDVRTTMIHGHTVKSKTRKEAMSPRDF
ncbi:hypothetical protein [Desulfonatronospira sp.]|nr:hypothetical protein [Desulfonatronospira sp.]